MARERPEQLWLSAREIAAQYSISYVTAQKWMNIATVDDGVKQIEVKGRNKDQTETRKGCIRIEKKPFEHWLAKFSVTTTGGK